LKSVTEPCFAQRAKSLRLSDLPVSRQLGGRLAVVTPLGEGVERTRQPQWGHEHGVHMHGPTKHHHSPIALLKTLASRSVVTARDAPCPLTCLGCPAPSPSAFGKYGSQLQRATLSFKEMVENQERFESALRALTSSQKDRKFRGYRAGFRIAFPAPREARCFAFAP